MDLLNRGELVGYLVDCVPDTWYLEGRFIPADSPAALRFAAAASALDPRVAHRDPTHAIRTLLRESADDEGTLFIVMSLSADRLCGRRVFAREAVEWATANVPE